MTTAPPKPPITCHVLDTITGRPAANMRVTLSLVSADSTSTPLTAYTDADGRVGAWAGSPALEERFAAAASAELVWALRFDAGTYFKGEGFWTEIEIRFRTDPGGGEGARAHWHVPLLLGPWSYTTYRGS